MSLSKKPDDVGFVAMRLKFAGAPESWHVIGGTPGLYHPIIPTISDAVGLSVDEARSVAKNVPDRIEIIDVSIGEAEAARKAYGEALSRSRRGVSRHARTRSATDDIITNEHQAAQGAASKEG